MKKQYSLFLTICFVLFQINTYSQTDTTLSTFLNVHQGNGAGLATRTVIDTFLFPHDLAGYDSIKMHVLLNCPTGGCDPWDRFANVLVWHDSDWYEIGRYMTPYGRSCGWTIDVSDYRDMLHDTVIIKSFIDTWTNPGWLVNLDFIFSAGTPLHPNIKVENLWSNYNAVYGDTTQPTILAQQLRTVESNATLVKVKIVNTGHGQGNTNNAAEFSQKTHQVWVNGTISYSQFLWRTDCATNPCSPQSGTWQYNRAGWCPGADVIPDEYDITSHVTPGSSVTLDYELQSYFNLCSPNNPGCVTGSTCADCNYNYNGHTEPHYKIAGQMISYLSSPVGIKETPKIQFTVLPNPAQDIFTIQLNEFQPGMKAEIFSLVGLKVASVSLDAQTQDIETKSLSEGVYLLHISGIEKLPAKKIFIIR